MFELISSSPQPLCISNVQNGNSIIRNNGTKSPLTNSFAFSFRHLFVVAKYDALLFDDFDGLVTGLTGWGGIIGVQGTGVFYSLNEMFPYTTWKASVNGSNVNPAAIPGPMNAFTVTHVSAASPVPFNGLSIGHDRDFTNRKWNGDVAEVIICEKPLLGSDVWEIEEYLMTKWQIS